MCVCVCVRILLFTKRALCKGSVGRRAREVCGRAAGWDADEDKLLVPVAVAIDQSCSTMTSTGRLPQIFSVTALIAPDSAIAARSRRSGCQTTLAGRSVLPPDPSRRRREVALPQPWDDVYGICTEDPKQSPAASLVVAFCRRVACVVAPQRWLSNRMNHACQLCPDECL